MYGGPPNPYPNPTWRPYPHTHSLDGCYKGVGFIFYDDQTMTPAIEARGDAIQRDRICDADCYGPDGCNIYKQVCGGTAGLWRRQTDEE